MTKKQNFPFYNWPSGEWGIFNTNTSFGLYLYRFCQYRNLADSCVKQHIDLSKIDEADRKFFQDSALHFARPLGALILGMQIVALEDYLRYQLDSLLNNSCVLNLYPDSNKQLPKDKSYGERFKLSNISELNQRCERAFGFYLIEEIYIKQIHDLVRIRNIIFHFGGIVSDQKRAEFDFYQIDREQIDVNYQGLQELSDFIYQRASHIDKVLRTSILARIRDSSLKDWKTKPSPDLLSMIKEFNYLGHLTTLHPGMVAGDLSSEQKLILEKEMIEKCLQDIEKF